MSRTWGVLIACVLCACAAAKTPPDAEAPDAAPPDATVDASPDAMPDACVPVAETCNGMDDDCDSMTDEDFTELGTGCMIGVGTCAVNGVRVCSPDGTTTICDGTPNQPGVETCNGLDDDCDTMTDEDFQIDQGCDGPDTDACIEGVWTCDGNGGRTCTDNSSSTPEICNGIDDDCANGIDDGFAVGVACAQGVGACKVDGTQVCNAAGDGVQCSAVAGSPTPELCGDGVDQDCNGADIACPTNDGPTGALDITNGGTFAADLSAAHDDNYFNGTFCGSTGGRDLFYKFTLPAAEVVYMDTFGSDFDSVIRIFAGQCTALGANQFCVDDQCGVRQTQGAVQLAAGTYCLVVDQYSSSQTTGTSVLTFARGGRTGTAISASSGSQTGNTCTAGSSQTVAGCQSNSTANDVGYFFLNCPSTTKTIAANTCTGTTWDSVVYMRKGSATGSDVACNDDGCALQSTFTGAIANATGLYWLIVDGYTLASTNCGAYTLTYTIN